MNSKHLLFIVLSMVCSALGKDVKIKPPPVMVCDNVITPQFGPFKMRNVWTKELGMRSTYLWRAFGMHVKETFSLWHDIPLYHQMNNTRIINMVVEVPRFWNYRVEINRKEPLNPLFHLSRAERPAYLYSYWPMRSYPFTYGSIPQTWENPYRASNVTDLVGDNNPIDIVDLATADSGYFGQVRVVKILGGLAIVENNVTDWKVFALNVQDPLAKFVNSVEDFEFYRPGVTKAYYDWFRYYTVKYTKKLNTIHESRFYDAATMMQMIAQSHQQWRELIVGLAPRGDISIWQTSQPRVCNHYVPPGDAAQVLGLPQTVDPLTPTFRRPEMDRWVYLDQNFMPIPEKPEFAMEHSNLTEEEYIPYMKNECLTCE